MYVRIKKDGLPGLRKGMICPITRNILGMIVVVINDAPNIVLTDKALKPYGTLLDRNLAGVA